MDGAAKSTGVPYLSSAPPEVTSRSILDLLQDDDVLQTIVTFSERLDEILGGGVPVTKITEILGVPGTGKTQLCLQLAVDVQIPQCFGGVGGECLYIDTEHCFSVERFKQIAAAAIEHCLEMADSSPESMEAIRTFTLDSVLSGLHFLYCMDSTQLIAHIENMDEILRERNIKLIVIDSVALPIRIGIGDVSLRTRVLSGLAQKLIQIAVTRKIAVVITNHMTTKLNTDRSSGRLVPALGESWGHVSSTRILLERDSDSGERTATLLKSSSRPGGCTSFQITSDGIRDVVTSDGIGDGTSDGIRDVVTSDGIRDGMTSNRIGDAISNSDKDEAHEVTDSELVELSLNNDVDLSEGRTYVTGALRGDRSSDDAVLPPTKRARIASDNQR